MLNAQYVRFFLVLFFLTLMRSTAPSQTEYWQELSGPYGGQVYSLIAQPTTEYLFAGAFGGVFRSTNLGATWKHVGLNAATVFAMAANRNGVLFAGTQSGVFRSISNGDLWIPQSGLKTHIIFSIDVNAKSGDIFAGAKGGIIIRSTDDGATWMVVHDAIQFNTDVLALTSDANGIVYAGTYGNAVWKSDDYGATWVQPRNNNLMHSGIVSLTYKPATNTVFAGTNGAVYKTANQGVDWTLATPTTSATMFAITINPGGAIFAGSDHGVFRSINDGTSWTQVNYSLADTNVRALKFNTTGGQTFVGTDGSGVFHSSDAGNLWYHVGVPFPTIFKLRFSSIDQLFAATNDSIFKSFNQGATWMQTNEGIPTSITHDIAIDGARGRIYAGTNKGMYRSTDNGMHWIEINNGITQKNIQALGVTSDGHVFAGSASGLYYSSDAGANWISRSVGLTDSTIYVIGINKTTGMMFVSTLTGGVYRSSDNGASWKAANGGWNSPQINAFAFNSAGDLYAGSFGNGIYRTTDNGNIWTEINSGIPTASGIYVNAFAVNSLGHIFAGCSSIGVYKTTDRGASWVEINSGLNVLNIMSLAIDSKGFLYAGMLLGGTYRSKQTTVPVIDRSEASPGAFFLEQNFPNPFTDRTTIKLTSRSVEHSNPIIIKFFDLFGREVLDLPEGTWKDSSITVLKTQLPHTGVYFYSTSVDGYTQTRKMIVY